jgi:hypothetical protein
VFRLVTVAEDGTDPQLVDDRAFVRTAFNPFDLPYDDAPKGRWLVTSARLAHHLAHRRLVRADVGPRPARRAGKAVTAGPRQPAPVHVHTHG